MLVRNASVKDATNCAAIPKPWSTKPKMVIHFSLKQYKYCLN